jgi:D-amino-acid dehydrogenase
MQRVAVIGAGITGITTAYSLLRQGVDVTVFDRHRYAAMETSFANGGQLSASNAEVWNQWGTIFNGMKWLFDKNAPLSLSMRPSLHKYRWLAEFLANIPNYEKHTIATVKLAIEARTHLLEMAQSAGIDFDVEKRDILHFYKGQSSFDHATKVNALLRKGGLERRAVTAEEMREIEPTLTGDMYGGYFTESDFTGDIHKFATGLANAAQARGANLRFDTDVRAEKWTRNGVLVSSAPTGSEETFVDRYDCVVVCAGVASKYFASMLGDDVNIYPVKGYSITVDLDDARSQSSAPWVSLLDDDAKIVTSRLGLNRFRVAGTAEINGANRDIRDDRIRLLVEWTRKLFPGVNTQAVTPWAGLRPMHARHDAEGWSRPAAWRLLQHWPRASWLDAVRRNGAQHMHSICARFRYR